MSDTQMYGVFGPGDGKPVAVYADHDEAAREGRKRFGGDALVFPVSLTASELKAAAEANPALAPAPSGPARANRLEVLRSEARAELQNELIKEQLKAEMRGEVEAEMRSLFTAVTEPDTAAAVEAARASHEAVTGEALPDGALPPSGVHSAGPAPRAAGRGDEELRQPLPEPGGPIAATSVAAPEPTADYGRMNLADLKAAADSRGISYGDGATKAEIRAALEA